MYTGEMQSADPTAPLVCVCVCIGGLKDAVPVYQWKNIALNVPFWMAPGTFLNVCGKGPVSTFPKRHAHGLRFFTRTQNVHASE